MNSKHFKILPLFITAIILTLGLSISFQSLLAAWTAPAANPPTCVSGNPGCDAPINTGSAAQYKVGALGIGGAVHGYSTAVFDGNVGIGTTGPGSTLHVYSTTNADVKVQDATALLRFIPSSGANYIQSGLISTGGSTADLFFTDIGNSHNWMTIKGTSGNVGIGTTNPTAAKLEVAGQVKITGGTPGANKVLTSDAVGLASWQTPSSGIGGSGTVNYVPKFTAASTLGNSLIYDNGTNVGIGTTGPVGALDVRGTTAISGGSGTNFKGLVNVGTPGTSGGSFFVNTTGLANGWNAGLGISGSFDSGLYSTIKLGAYGVNWSGYGSRMAFYTHDTITATLTERMRINERGNVGIGTTGPGAQLQINPPTGVEGLRIVTASDFSPLNIRNNANSADLFRIDQNGDIRASKTVYKDASGNVIIQLGN